MKIKTKNKAHTKHYRSIGVFDKLAVNNNYEKINLTNIMKMKNTI